MIADFKNVLKRLFGDAVEVHDWNIAGFLKTGWDPAECKAKQNAPLPMRAQPMKERVTAPSCPHLAHRHRSVTSKACPLDWKINALQNKCCRPHLDHSLLSDVVHLSLLVQLASSHLGVHTTGRLR